MGPNDRATRRAHSVNHVRDPLAGADIVEPPPPPPPLEPKLAETLSQRFRDNTADDLGALRALREVTPRRVAHTFSRCPFVGACAIGRRGAPPRSERQNCTFA
jgi:hypothetical protein